MSDSNEIDTDWYLCSIEASLTHADVQNILNLEKVNTSFIKIKTMEGVFYKKKFVEISGKKQNLKTFEKQFNKSNLFNKWFLKQSPPKIPKVLLNNYSQYIPHERSKSNNQPTNHSQQTTTWKKLYHTTYPSQHKKYGSQHTSYPSQHTFYPSAQKIYSSQHTTYPSQHITYPSHATYPPQHTTHPSLHTTYPSQHTAYPLQQNIETANVNQVPRFAPRNNHHSYDNHKTQIIQQQNPNSQNTRTTPISHTNFPENYHSKQTAQDSNQVVSFLETCLKFLKKK